MTQAQHTNDSGSYGRLLADRGFESFLWTQLLGAFNDNVYKMIVSIMALRIAADQALGSRYLALAGAVFVIPFLLFAGPAGQLADRFSKTRVLQWTKAWEIGVMLTGIAALLSHHIGLLLLVLFLLAMQANFFSPAKYGILPEMLGEAQLSRANGLLELTTFVAIVIGTSFGTFLFEHWQTDLLKVGLTLLGFAVVGSVASLGITYAPPSGSREPFHLNPFHEVAVGMRGLLRRRALWRTVIGISWFWFIGGLFQMSLLLLGQESLHASETRVGLLVTALALGIGVGSLVAGRLSGDHVELGLVPFGSALLGVFSIALGMTHSYNTAVVWLAAVGFAGGLFIVPLNAYLQEEAGAEEKGRVLATNNFLNMIGVILASGVLWMLHDKLHFSAGQVIITLGAVTLAATIYITSLLPDRAVRLLVACLAHLMFRIRVVGRENLPRTGAALLVANHVSYADAVLLGLTTPRFVRFLMWQQYFDVKALRWFFRLARAIPLPVVSPKASVRALRAAREELKRGEMAGIFPEGSLTRTGQVMPFQRGFEKVLEGTDAPVIPVFLDGLWGHRLSRRGGSLARRTVTIYIGEPIHERITPAEVRDKVLDLGNVAAMRRGADATFGSRFVTAARRNWGRTALADSTPRELTFGRSLTGAVLVANWLAENRSDERVIGVLLPASVAGAVVNLGVALAGRTAVNLNFTVGEAGMSAAIEKCGLRTIVTSRKFLEKIKIAGTADMVFAEDLMQFGAIAKLRAMLLARFAPVGMIAGKARARDTAAIIFSSGSTGEPKGAMLTHANLLANIDSVAQIYDMGPGDCMLGALPFFHSFGYTYTLWFPLLQGASSVFHPNPMDGKTIGELAAKYKAGFLISTPTFCLNYLRHCTREQFASLRCLLTGAEKLRPAVAQAIAEKFGITPLEGYGCTEMGPVVAVNIPDVTTAVPPQIGNRPGSVGRPIPGIAVRVVNPDTMEPVPCGEPGLLLVSGPSRMAGYIGDPDKTAAALHHGFYITGDIARVDEDGFLYIVDRVARMSKIGGEMVPHLKVEEALSGALHNSPCIVVGIPDEQRGERLVALYTSPDVTPGQLYDHLAAHALPALWIPKRENFYRVDAIPALGTGKADLRRAREIAQERAAAKAVVRS